MTNLNIAVGFFFFFVFVWMGSSEHIKRDFYVNVTGENIMPVDSRFSMDNWCQNANVTSKCNSFSKIGIAISEFLYPRNNIDQMDTYHFIVQVEPGEYQVGLGFMLEYLNVNVSITFQGNCNPLSHSEKSIIILDEIGGSNGYFFFHFKYGGFVKFNCLTVTSTKKFSDFYSSEFCTFENKNLNRLEFNNVNFMSIYLHDYDYQRGFAVATHLRNVLFENITFKEVPVSPALNNEEFLIKNAIFMKNIRFSNIFRIVNQRVVYFDNSIHYPTNEIIYENIELKNIFHVPLPDGMTETIFPYMYASLFHIFQMENIVFSNVFVNNSELTFGHFFLVNQNSLLLIENSIFSNCNLRTYQNTFLNLQSYHHTIKNCTFSNIKYNYFTDSSIKSIITFGEQFANNKTLRIENTNFFLNTIPMALLYVQEDALQYNAKLFLNGVRISNNVGVSLFFAGMSNKVNGIIAEINDCSFMNNRIYQYRTFGSSPCLEDLVGFSKGEVFDARYGAISSFSGTVPSLKITNSIFEDNFLIFTQRTSSISNYYMECSIELNMLCKDDTIFDICTSDSEYYRKGVSRHFLNVKGDKSYCSKSSYVGCYDPRAALATTSLIFVGCFIFILVFCIGVLAIIVSIFLLRTVTKQKVVLKKYNEIDDIDILLEEKKVFDNDKSLAKLKINKKLFEVDLKDVEMIRMLGSGGSNSEVFLVSWKKKYAALKLFGRSAIFSDDSYEEFEKEVEILASVSHPHILTWYGAILTPKVGILMEFASEGELSSFILKFHQKNNVKFPVNEKIRFLLEIAMSLGHLHSLNIIHRDLKPQNVLICSGYIAKIMDFGISKIVKSETEKKTKRVGTSYYMAPEVFSGSDYNEKCDVFSFGILIFALMSQKFHFPYGKGLTLNIELKVANDANFRPKIIDEDYKGVPKWLIELQKKCYDHIPENRPSFEKIIDLLLGKKKDFKEIAKKVSEEVDNNTRIKDLEKNVNELRELLKQKDEEIKAKDSKIKELELQINPDGKKEIFKI